MNVSYVNKDFTYFRLFFISVPTMLALAVEQVSGLIDVFFIGRISSELLAGFSITNTVVSSIAWVFGFFSFIVSVYTSYYIGKKKDKELQNFINDAFLTAVFFGVLVAILIVFAFDSIFVFFFNASSSLAQITYPYWLFRSLGLPMTMSLYVGIAALRGLSEYKYSLLALFVTAVVNIVVSYISLYIFNFGLLGVGFGTFISLFIGNLLVLNHLSGLGYKIKISQFSIGSIWQWLHSYKTQISRSTVRSIVISSVFNISLTVVGGLGVASIASHQIALSSWLFVSYVIDGFAVTASTIGSKLYAQAANENFRFVSKRLLNLGLFFGFFFMFLYSIFSDFIFTLFSRDLIVLGKVKDVWWLVCLFQPINALVYVFDGILFSMREFYYLQKSVILAFFLFFLPCLLISFYLERSLFYVWLSLGLFNLYRLLSSSYLFFTLKTKIK